jgi:hypothetical protein
VFALTGRVPRTATDTPCLSTARPADEREGITWTPIEYFDNAIVVQLLEGKPGVFTLLGEWRRW